MCPHGLRTPWVLLSTMSKLFSYFGLFIVTAEDPVDVTHRFMQQGGITSMDHFEQIRDFVLNVSRHPPHNTLASPRCPSLAAFHGSSST